MSARTLKSVGLFLAAIGAAQVSFVAILYGGTAAFLALAALVTGGGGLYIYGLGVARRHVEIAVAEVKKAREVVAERQSCVQED